MAFPPLRFKNGTLELLDQRKLPLKETWVKCRNSKQVYTAIRDMIVRGAPAIGIAGGYGLYLGIRSASGNRSKFLKVLRQEAEYLKSARPTAVNLGNIIDRLVNDTKKSKYETVSELKQFLLEKAIEAHEEDDLLCRTMGRHGARLFKNKEGILTHCNAGGLATTGYGTALGVIYAAKERGLKLRVYADETRPLLQGARLTAWELQKSGIDCTLICDNMAATTMRSGKIQRVIVGADRIAANGDTANKIGTYNVALLAKAHHIPFYVAAPRTTFDFKARTGKQIPIENRADIEVTEGFGKRTAPKGIRVVNPAFDVTPHELITAFITEAGVLKPPFSKSFRKLKSYAR